MNERLLLLDIGFSLDGSRIGFQILRSRIDIIRIAPTPQ